MWNKWKWYNVHHIIWQSNRNWANINDDRNKMVIDKIRHDWLNSLFRELQSPHEQLMYLRQMYNDILSDTSKKLFDELLWLWVSNFYQEWLVKWTKEKT